MDFYNGYGGFDEKGNYRIIKEALPPLPWGNCVSCFSGKPFGFFVTETGDGFVWSGNSHEYRLTPWYSDPYDNTLGEDFVITTTFKDSGKSHVDKLYSSDEVIHAPGYTVFLWKKEYIQIELKVFVPEDDSVKISFFKCRVEDEAEVKIEYRVRILGGEVYEPYTALMLGDYRIGDNAIVFDEKIFMSGSLVTDSPEGYFTQDDYDSVLENKIHIKKGIEAEFCYLLGTGEDTLAEKYKNILNCKSAFENVVAAWEKYLDTIKIECPDKEINLMINRWLPYQVLSCRINGRSGYYQSGGAYGFRDQLQDVLSLLMTFPKKAREMILMCASHQYEQGDVQHWWHPPVHGVRTRCSDDMLWLVYVTGEYISVTGDVNILYEKVPFLVSEPLKEGERDRYENPSISGEKATLYEHCKRAVKKGCGLGDKGLPLIGSGDWNDGMDRLGIKGRGQSVWLGWFLSKNLEMMTELASAVRKDIGPSKQWMKMAETIIENVEQHCWEGDRYIRAYDDRGEAVGSSKCHCCAIDSLPQSWSVISGRGNLDRSRIALATAGAILIDDKRRIVKLLHPPFTRRSKEKDPGYIASYPPGIRENGGQYTHGAVWLAKAFLLSGDTEEGYKILSYLNPISHALTSGEVNIYKVEPYVMAGDVYSDEKNKGRGGWSWYTGSAGWYYNVVINDLLGIQKKGSYLVISSRLPKAWQGKGYRFRYRYGNTVYNIRVVNPKAEGKIKLIDDGEEKNYDL